MKSKTFDSMARSTAVGKAILVGEHFVVWGGTALGIPIRSARLQVELEASPGTRNAVTMEHPDAGLLKKASAAGIRSLLPGVGLHVSVQTKSNFPMSAGLGGSASYSVAFCRALMKIARQKPDDDRIAQSALDMEKVFHGTPSGIDSTTIAFDTPCFVKTGKTFYVGNPEGQASGPLAGFIDVAPGAVLVLADSGERGNTREALQKVAHLRKVNKGDQILTKLTAVAETIALQTAHALRKGDFDYVGLMMTENHYLLQAIGVSTPRLDALCNVALNSGAMGAKLTGGGLGGFVVALCLPDALDRLKTALREAGCPQILVQETDDFA